MSTEFVHLLLALAVMLVVVLLMTRAVVAVVVARSDVVVAMTVVVVDYLSRLNLPFQQVGRSITVSRILLQRPVMIHSFGICSALLLPSLLLLSAFCFLLVPSIVTHVSVCSTMLNSTRLSNQHMNFSTH